MRKTSWKKKKALDCTSSVVQLTKVARPYEGPFVGYSRDTVLRKSALKILIPISAAMYAFSVALLFNRLPITQGALFHAPRCH